LTVPAIVAVVCATFEAEPVVASGGPAATAVVGASRAKARARAAATRIALQDTRGERELRRGYDAPMLIGIVIVVCIVLAILAFLLPRLSRYPERGVERTYGAGGRVAGKAPGRLGRWLRKPFDTANKATRKSASAGRRGRAEL
jgi:hypothetical protein